MSYKMTHPDSDATIEVEADQVANYESQGWSTKANARPRPQTVERAPDVVLDDNNK